jgi:uncharacterized protein YegL
MSGFTFTAGTDGTVRNHPIYLLLDVSESMRRAPRPGVPSPQAVFTPLLDRLVQDLGGTPRINSCVWVSLLAFSDDVQRLRDMHPVREPAFISKPADGQETNYTKALRYLQDQYPKDRQYIEGQVAGAGKKVRVSRPLVFVITDGAPYANRMDQSHDEWLVERNDLVRHPIEARIAVISLTDKREYTLWQLATGPELNRNAFIAAPNASSEDLARSIKESITASIQQSVRAIGEFQMRTPRGMTRIARTGHA